MANFIVRVELIDISGNSILLYGKIHEAMKNRGFKKTIGLQGQNSRYELPDAEYFIRADVSVINIRDVVKETVKLVWTNFRILVVEAEEIAGYNLREVNE